MRPCVRCATLDGYVGLARSLGLDPVGLTSSVGLDLADLAIPDKWIPAGDVARLLELSAASSGCDDFGLRLAALRRLSTLGPLSVVLGQEPDLRSALDLLTRYERTYNEALHLRLEEANDIATIRLWMEFSEPAPTRQSLELAAAALLGIVRQLLGRHWQPLSVCFTHGPPVALDRHRAVFGGRLPMVARPVRRQRLVMAGQHAVALRPPRRTPMGRPAEPPSAHAAGSRRPVGRRLPGAVGQEPTSTLPSGRSWKNMSACSGTRRACRNPRADNVRSSAAPTNAAIPA